MKVALWIRVQSWSESSGVQPFWEPLLETPHQCGFDE